MRSTSNEVDQQWRERIQEVLGGRFDGHPRPDWERELMSGAKRMADGAYHSAAHAFEAAAFGMYVADAAEMDRVHLDAGLHPWQLCPLCEWATALEKVGLKEEGAHVSRLLTRAMKYLCPLLRRYVRTPDDRSKVEDFERRLDTCMKHPSRGELPVDSRMDPVRLAREMSNMFAEVRKLRLPLPDNLRVT